MAELLELNEAINRLVPDGATVALEGFTHLIPFAAGHEIIRQGKRDLTLVRLTPDLIYDQLIGAGCASRLVFSWGGNPGVGSLHRLRDAVEHGWPQPLDIVEHSHAGMASAFQAGASGLPFAVLKAYSGSALRNVNPQIVDLTCPFTGEVVSAVPALRPDVTIIHAQRADRQGNVLLEGIVGVQKEAVLAATASLVVVEEVVDDLAPPSPNSHVIPGWAVDAISVAAGGASPSYVQGYYERDNRFYTEWDRISRDRETFTAWIDDHVMNGPADSPSASAHIGGTRG
jgi:glutaconate CoA-transferase, subunit A